MPMPENFLKILSSLWRDCCDFFFPPVCHLCGEHCNESVCAKCVESLATLDSGYKPSDTQSFAKKRNTTNGRIAFVRPLAPFDTDHKQLIHLLKYSGIIDIGRFFGKRIGEMVRNEPDFKKYETFIPVPLHKNRHRERRYNQAEIIASEASEVSGKEIRADIIARVKHTESQTKLNPSERRDNVRNAFAVVKPEFIMGKKVILVDDVVTTGATIEEMAKALGKAGANDICAVCIAHPLRDESKTYRI